MPRYTHGNIRDTFKDPVIREIDRSNQVIGPCWTSIPEVPAPKGLTVSTKSRKFIVPGEDQGLIDELCDIAESAKTMICVSSFLIQKSRFTDALIEAAERGVAVFLLTARDEDLRKPSEEMMEGERERIEDHIALLKSLAGKVLVRTCDSFHAKYCLSDPQSRKPRGILMTCNANLDPMSGVNREIAVTLTKDDINGLFPHFLHGFWDMADHELLRSGRDFRGVNRENQNLVETGTITVPATWNEGTSLQSRVLELIGDARQTLLLTAWSFDPDYVIIDAIDTALEQGVKVRILTKPTPKTSRALISLADKGAEILGHDRFHAKIILADGKKGLIMTANFTRLGLDTGFEAGIEINDSDVSTLAKIIPDLVSVCPWKFSSKTTLESVEGKVLGLKQNSMEFDSFEVIPEDTIKISTLSVSSLADIPEDLISENDLSRSMKGRFSGKMVRKIIARREVTLPQLPKDAKLEKRDDVKLPVYRNKQGAFIAISKWEEFPSADKSAGKVKAKIVIF